jgi:hypothetical protein
MKSFERKKMACLNLATSPDISRKGLEIPKKRSQNK